MSDTAHDPPAEQLTPQGFDLLKTPVDLPPERLALLSGPNFEKYVLMRDRLGGREPLAVVVVMKQGGYRFKSRRGAPGVLVLDADGRPVPDRMSFRQIAPILAKVTGVPVTYETVRRWWEIVFPSAEAEPDETFSPDDVNGPSPDDLREASDIVVKAARTTRRKPVGDEAAEQIRAAVEAAKEAAAPTTNPDVPSAVFLPPTD